MASTFKLKRKCFGNKGFDAGTWSGLLSDNTAEGQAKKAAYSKKYATEVSNYTKNTALATTPKPNKMGTMGKIGIGAAVATGGYLLGKGLGLWGNKKDK